jgi:RNA polymerase primary sigma factor
MWWIRQGITRAMADQARTIRIPVHMVEQLSKLSRLRRDKLQELGREPTHEELAVELDRTPKQVEEMLLIGREPISLHTPLGEDGDSQFGDLIEDTDIPDPLDTLEHEEKIDSVRRVLAGLEPRDARVLSLRFGIGALGDNRPHTLDEIARDVGLTRERIRQIEKEALRKLRDPDMQGGALGVYATGSTIAYESAKEPAKKGRPSASKPPIDQPKVEE